MKGRASLTFDFKVCISEFVTSQLVQKPHGSAAIKKNKNDLRIPGWRPFCCFNSNLWTICPTYNTRYAFVLIHSIMCGHILLLFTAIAQKHHYFEFPGSLNSDSGSVFQAGHQPKVSAIHHSGMKLNNQLYLTSCTFNVTFFFATVEQHVREQPVRRPCTSSLSPLNLAATTWFSPHCKQHPVTLNTSHCHCVCIVQGWVLVVLLRPFEVLLFLSHLGIRDRGSFAPVSPQGQHCSTRRSFRITNDTDSA